MKLRYVLLLLTGFILLHLNAQNSVSSYQIKWNGIDVWTAGTVTKSVISFDGATYPDGSLPYFTKTIDCTKNSQYDIRVINTVLSPLTDEKELTIATGFQIPSDVEVKSFKQFEQNNSRLVIQILPFVKKEGVIYKLQSFDLSYEAIQAPLKAPATIHTYAPSSVLATGKFVKVKLSQSGIYKLTYEALNSMGIDPANVKIFGYGGAVLEQNFTKLKYDDLPEIAIYMNKGGDGVFNSGDYILFYGQGVTAWQYDDSRKMFVHSLNSYSNEGYYFVTSDVGTGKKIQDITNTTPEKSNVVDVDQFVDYQVHEKEAYSIINSGKTFYGEQFVDVATLNFPFAFPNIIKTATTKVRVDLMAFSPTVTNYTLKLNDSQSQSIAVQASTTTHEMGKSSNAYFTFTPATDNVIVNISKQTGSAKGYLNYIEVNARRQLIMTGSVMSFRNIDSLNTKAYNRFKLSGANTNVQIWDITDPINIKRIVTSYSNGQIEFTDSNEKIKEYVAIDPTAVNSFAQPTIGTVVANQNLHAMPSADFIIITHPRFLTQANLLAETHRSKDNMLVNVITTEQIYNEFSSGTPDATAYRWAVKMFYDRALASNGTQVLPKYLLLFGRGSYDNRKILNNSSESLVLTYQADESLHLVDSYVTDDYFGLLDDNEGNSIKTELLDVGIGRFPVLTEQQAKDVVAKTISYMNNTQKGIWKNQWCYVGDDGGDNNGNIHMYQADNVAQLVYAENQSVQLNKIYLDSYKQETNASGESYPLAKAKLNSLIHSGLFMLNYTGHAGPYGWSNEQILTTADVLQLYNEKLPLWIAATCDFVAIDSKEISAGEHVLLNPAGGGIGILSAARTVYSANNYMLNRPFSYNLIKKNNGLHNRLGDALRLAKNSITDLNKLSYILLADPALRLTYPTDYKVVTNKINGRVVEGNDTLKALSVDSIQGYITDGQNNKITDYNGTVEITIYDKNQQITTLNNHADGFLVYNDRPNIIYSGKTDVKNGEFSVTLMVPKDIRYNYGTGRINYYASEPSSDREAQGFFENFTVGGTASHYDTNDVTGPVLSTFLNHRSFVSGDKVNETPVFIADITDENGINTSGSGIGHDLRLVIDENPLTSYSLNEYFYSSKNSYKTGTVTYKIPKLAEGKHTLTFHAWDLLNNSSSSSLDFEVVNGLTPSIFGVSVYPNPAKISAKFVIEHDRPQTVLEVTIDVYDLVGRKVWTKTQRTTEDLVWDLRDFEGKKLQKGMYVYKASLKTSTSTLTSKANKILITSLQ